jgi:hypothetical protein
VRGVRVDAARVGAASQQQGDHPRTVRLRRGQQGRAAVGVARVHERGIGGEQIGHRGFLAALDRREQRGHTPGPLGASRRVEVSAERAPAREAVLPRDRELGVGQTGARVRPAQFLEPILGELLEVLEAGTIG